MYLKLTAGHSTGDLTTENCRCIVRINNTSAFCVLGEFNRIVRSRKALRAESFLIILGEIMQIAIYGKGGIGKSTVSANLSAALASCGRKVLQIGCDPKHDSTRLLHHGRKVQTVLEYLLNTPPDEQMLESVLMEGYLGTGCVEAGGPKPGMGCAGRDILTAFEFLDRFQVRKGYDHVVYDVLGDVVCGGFAVPVRKQYAEAVFLVTSGEAMALYAANNILQGIRNLDPEENRIAGIIYNSRGAADESRKVEAFAQAVGLPVRMKIPRSSLFAEAEKEAATVVEKEPESREAELFLALAGQIAEKKIPLHKACPLSEEEMECFMRGEPVYSSRISHTERREEKKETKLREKEQLPVQVLAKRRALSDPFSRVPLFGCAFNGAVALAIHVKDAAVLAHAPRSCVWFSQNGFSAYARRGFFERGILYPAFIPQHFTGTDMTIEDAVFGGVEHARQKALELAGEGVKTIIAVTSCIPGMSGDDLTPVQEELRQLGCEMYLVKTDGVEAGDYNQGMALCYKTLAEEAVWEDEIQEPDSINFVYELTWSSRTDENFQRIKELLDALHIRVNCRFICAGTMEDIHHFLRAPYSILAREDELGRELKTIFEEKYGCKFLDGTLPRGFEETSRWVRMLGELYGKQEEVKICIQKNQECYEKKIQELKAHFSGKRVVIFMNYGNCDWLFELAEDLDLMILKTILLGKKNEGNAGWNQRFSAEWSSYREMLRQEIEKSRPDLVLVNDPSALADIPENICVIQIPRDIQPGFLAGADAAEEWIRKMDRKVEGRWKHDRAVFEKYYC